ncbi:hypothetical protein N798_11215 [Knoellia flava TL1]|uniref:Peptidoglycan recognition protein family domain-containing protein n=2 Tax=Knoellia flava TaxID=913969 RepID=A0A8H9FWQ4_9MICO|nr:FG-GAP-like repeat-containing protein [Knoellia flava]KGN30264.1 hypothetical protein N798_11215 [Knoellia flava TL1]GGB84513.1 hypothetical protein GCM10011314_25210 [Knoellia flava]
MHRPPAIATGVLLAALGLVTANPAAASPSAEAPAESPVAARASAASAPKARTVAFAAVPSSARAKGVSAQDRETAEHHGVPAFVTAATRPIAVEDRATAIGVTWSGRASQGVVQWRFRADGGAAGAWSELPTGAHGPDAGSAEARAARTTSDPLLTTDPGSVELRVLGGSAPASSLVATVDEPGGAAEATAPDASRAPAPGSPTATRTSSSTPTILTRASWGADESMRKGSPSYGAVKGEVVHHTVNANTYAADDVPALIRAIYAYHVQRNGWNDIGYNFLIDRFGRTWEGRFGGTNRAVVGAHSPGVNSWTTSASTIGNFSSSGTSVPAAVTAAYQSLFTWKARLHQLEPEWTVNLGGTTQRSISGHRDNTSTECPGDALYARIPAITSAVAAATPDSPALTVRRDADNAGGNDVLTIDRSGRLALVTADDSGLLQEPETKTTLDPTGFDMLRVVGDWDGDGAVDVVGRFGNGSLYLFAGAGDGGFEPPVRIGVGWNTMRIMTGVGDVTGDEHPDLIAATATSSELRVYPGDGRGSFLVPKVIGTAGWGGIRSLVGVGDWDRDGDADVLGIWADGRPTVYANRGDGLLRTGPTLDFRAPEGSVVSAIGDVTFDTLVDLVVKDEGGTVRVAASTADPAVTRWVEQSGTTVSTWRSLTPQEG